MNITTLSILAKMLNNCRTVTEYIAFVRREVPSRLPVADQQAAYRACKLAFAASHTPNYEIVNSRSVTAFRRMISSMCGPDGSMRMIQDGKIYRLINLRFAASVASEEEINMVIEALEMTMAYVPVNYSDEVTP